MVKSSSSTPVIVGDKFSYISEEESDAGGTVTDEDDQSGSSPRINGGKVPDAVTNAVDQEDGDLDSSTDSLPPFSSSSAQAASNMFRREMSASFSSSDSQELEQERREILRELAEMKMSDLLSELF